jgi:hypothetical protein
MNRPFPSPDKIMALAITVALMGSTTSVFADERSELEQLRATTMGLIDALVDNGILSREKAQQLMRDAEAKASARLAESRPIETGKDGKKVVRVAYVPEAMKNEIREQVKQEVLAQAKTERWGEPGALPEWLDRFQFEGDMRIRYESTQMSPQNTPAQEIALASVFQGLTRAGDIASSASSGGLSNVNTQEDSDRWRVRARLGVNAKVSDMVSAGLRITTGNTTNPVSTNQTLGQNFNKYSVVFDRAFIKVDPVSWFSASAGRIANPYFSTDLVWADDLSFDGVAATLKYEVLPSANAFLTAGWYPLSVNSPLQSSGRDLVGVQGGVDWKFGSESRAKFGVALYQYRGIQGTQESDDVYNFGFPTEPNYATRYEYPAGLRQRGNTLFAVNSPYDFNFGTGQLYGAWPQASANSISPARWIWLTLTRFTSFLPVITSRTWISIVVRSPVAPVLRLSTART